MLDIQHITSGLQFPEGPIACEDGSVLLVEIKRGTLSRVTPDGTIEVVAETGGGPNGAAIGPDGACYICNNGGFEWHDLGGFMLPGNQPADYTGGSIQRVDLTTGAVETRYTECGGIPLKGPNDIVFDAHGGFYFTDLGKHRERDQDRTGVFYAKPDGTLIREIIFPMEGPNGIGLSPDGKRLYVAETPTGRVWAFDIESPGVPAGDPNDLLSRNCLAGLPGMQMLDSLAVDGEGHVCVATLVNGGSTSISPDGSSVEHYATPDPLTTNICFGGEDLRTAYITLSGTGVLVKATWPRPGLALNC